MSPVPKSDAKRTPPIVDPLTAGTHEPLTFKDLSHDQRWAALFRAGIMSATTQKFFNYVNLADQKAQAMILLNTVLIPVALNWIERPAFHWPATVTILTAMISITAGIICIYPKRRSGKKPDGTINILHFSDIGGMKESQFLAEFMPIFNDLPRLAEAAAKDLHDVARRIIRPKFFWLKLSYIAFFFGNLAAILLTFYNLWVHPVLPP